MSTFYVYDCNYIFVSGEGLSTHFNNKYLLNDFYVKLAFQLMILQLPCGSDSKESACSVGDLGWEDPVEEGMAIHSNILAWRIPMDRGAWWATVHGVTESGTAE